MPRFDISEYAETTVEQQESIARIVDLRRARVSWPEIAKAVGKSPQAARDAYRRALAAIPAQSIDEHRAEELTLIDDAVADLMIIARDPGVSHRTRVEAWSAVRGWAERKAKLMGLDAPEQRVTVDLVDSEIAKLTAEIEKMEQATAQAAEQADA